MLSFAEWAGIGPDDLSIKKTTEELSLEAAQKLGYSALYCKVMGDKVGILIAKNSTSGHPIYTDESVKRFKEVKLAQTPHNPFGWVVFIGVAASFISLALSSDSSSVLLFTLTVLGFISSAFFFVAWWKKDDEKLQWEHKPMEGYQGFIPEHVLETALHLHDAHKELYLSIEYCFSKKGGTICSFLRGAVNATETSYFHVWENEPNFPRIPYQTGSWLKRQAP